MKIVRSPIGRSVAIVTMICAIALGNLATSCGTGCTHYSCWYRTHWYLVPKPTGTPYFVVWLHARAYCALNCSCSGGIWDPPGRPCIICGCIVNGCAPCPLQLNCNQVCPAVGSAISPGETNDVPCKRRR
jgi:hypothetical protein